MGWIGVADNTIQFFTDPNWEDGVQAVSGAILILYCGPLVLVALLY